MNSQTPMTRRHSLRLIATTAIGFTALGATGCAKPPGDVVAAENVPEQLTSEPTGVAGYALYKLDLQDNQLSHADVEERKLPTPIYIGRRWRAADEKQRPLQYVVWCHADDVERWTQVEGVNRLIEKQPSDVAEFGDDRDGFVYVSLRPHAELDATIAKPETFLTAAQIAERWRTQFANLTSKKRHKIDVETVKPDNPDLKVGHATLVEPGQIKVSCSDEVLSDAIVQAIKQHPQVVYLQWGKPFTTLYCPGCGLG